MVELVTGILIATFAYAIAEQINLKIIKKITENIKRPCEHVACNNATVLVDDHGEISWFNNDRLPQKIGKAKNRDDSRNNGGR